MPAIELEGVWKRYLIKKEAAWAILRLMMDMGKKNQKDRKNLFWALRDISFTVEPGEALGIIGPNGAGKTTLLRLLGHIATPTHGRLMTKGRIGALINLGAGFHPELTGRENISLNGVIMGMSRKEIARKFDSIVEFSGLKDVLDRPVKRYSSGMYARLGFSVAIHVDPDILLVDEVLAVGDTQFQKKCYQRIWDLVSHDRAVVFVSHNLWAVKQICNRIMFLKDGQVQYIGAPDEAIRAYEGYMYSVERSALQPTKIFGANDTETSVILEDIRLSDGTKELGKQIEMIRPLTIRFRFRKSISVDPVAFAIGFIRDDGLHCCTVFSDESDCVAKSDVKEGYVEVRFPRVLLLPAVYRLYVSALSPGPGLRLIHAQEHYPIEVRGPDYFNWEHGSQYMPSDWHLTV